MSQQKQRIATSMRGEEVNFDLADIKNRILADPEPDVSKQRARFVGNRRKRTRKKSDELLAEQRSNEAAVRAAIAEQKRAKLLSEPHVAVEDVVVESTPDVTATKQRRIVKE